MNYDSRIKNMDLEKKILKKVYTFEKRRTIWDILKFFFLILSGSSFVIFLVYKILSIYYEQQTLDLLELFREDFETIQENILNVTSTFYNEAPKELFAILAVFILFLVIVLLFVSKNFEKIKRRLMALAKKP